MYQFFEAQEYKLRDRLVYLENRIPKTLSSSELEEIRMLRLKLDFLKDLSLKLYEFVVDYPEIR